MSTFKIGDIVEVVGEDLNFRGKQGQVVAIISGDGIDDTIYVWHGVECDHLLCFRERELLDPSTEKVPPSADRCIRDSRVKRYVDADLVRVDEWNPEIVANRLFGNQWHSLTVFRPTALCHISGCRNPAQKEQTFFNLWGLVMVLTTCPGCHAKNHGICGDDLVRS